MRWGCSGKWPSLNHRESSQKLSLWVFAFRIVKINFWLFKQTSAQYFVMAAIGNKYGMEGSSWVAFRELCLSQVT